MHGVQLASTKLTVAPPLQGSPNAAAQLPASAGAATCSSQHKSLLTTAIGASLEGRKPCSPRQHQHILHTAIHQLVDASLQLRVLQQRCGGEWRRVGSGAGQRVHAEWPWGSMANTHAHSELAELFARA